TVPSLSSQYPYPPTAAIDTLSLHDALPISRRSPTFLAEAMKPSSSPERSLSCSASTLLLSSRRSLIAALAFSTTSKGLDLRTFRSEEHTSELQSRFDLVCRLLLERKNSSIL